MYPAQFTALLMFVSSEYQAEAGECALRLKNSAVTYWCTHTNLFTAPLTPSAYLVQISTAC
jgi:hypothetical protein